MSKELSVEQKLVSAETEVKKLAAENDTYTNRMKEMEGAISKAMERMKAMEEKMEEYAKMKATLDEKMTETKAELEVEIKNEEEDGEELSPEAENSLGGINEKVVAGQKKKNAKSKKAEYVEEEESKKEHESEPVEGEAEKKSAKKAKKATTTSEDESVGEPVNEKFIEEKEKKAKKKAEETPTTETIAEDVAPAPVAEEAKVETLASTPATPVVDVPALVEAKVAEVAQKFAMAESKFNELDAELAKAKETLAREAELKKSAMDTVLAMNAKYEALLAKISSIETSNKTVEEKVAKTVASLGVEPVINSPAETAVITKSAEDIVKEWESIADAKQARAYYLKHQKEIASATFPSKRG